MKKIKIAWGIDPNNSIEKIDNNTKRFFENLKQSYDEVEVYPIHVTSATVSIYNRYSESTQPIDFLPYIKKDVSQYLKKFSDIPLREAIVLENFTTFRRSELSVFADYVEELDCDFVLLASHGRTGIKRMMLGSFTENYLLRGSRPTFVINTETKKDFDLSHALIPLELEDESKEFVKEITNSDPLRFLKKIHLYHHVNSKDFAEQDWVPSLYTPTGHDYNYFISKAKKKSEDFLSSLVKSLSPEAEVTFSVSKEYTDSEEMIRFQAIKLDAGLLLLKSHHGRMDTLFSSSLARELVRKINVPVLVYPRKHQFEKETEQ